MKEFQLRSYGKRKRWWLRRDEEMSQVEGRKIPECCENSHLVVRTLNESNARRCAVDVLHNSSSGTSMPFVLLELAYSVRTLAPPPRSAHPRGSRKVALTGAWSLVATAKEGP